MTTTYSSEFGGFPLFFDVKNPLLRAWNRLNIVFNIKEMVKNPDMVHRYLKKFNRKDQTAIATMALRVREYGYENTRRELMRNR